MAVATRGGTRDDGRGGAEREARGDSRPRKALTIGAVCKILGQEFEDISISKIRYLEEQKLLSPARTSGGYRLYSQADVERLRAILRMQRDEFLPLRVIRQELASGRAQPGRSAGATANRSSSRGATISAAEMLERSGAKAGLVRELEEYGILQPDRRGSESVYDDSDVEIARAASELARFGVAARNLRVLRSTAEREASLLEQILAPSLRTRSPTRRREAEQSMEALAGVCTQLTHLLLVRDLRRLTE